MLFSDSPLRQKALLPQTPVIKSDSSLPANNGSKHPTSVLPAVPPSKETNRNRFLSHVARQAADLFVSYGNIYNISLDSIAQRPTKSNGCVGLSIAAFSADCTFRSI